MKQFSTFLAQQAHIAIWCVCLYFLGCSNSWGQTIGFANATLPILCKQNNGINFQYPTSVICTQSGSFGTGNVFTAQLVDANENFVANLGTSTSTSSTFLIEINQTIINTLPLGTTYRIRIVSSNPVVQSPLSDQNFPITVDNMTVSSSVLVRISGTQTIAPGQYGILNIVNSGAKPYSHRFTNGQESGLVNFERYSAYKILTSTTTYVVDYAWSGCVRGVGTGSATVTVTPNCGQPTLEAASSASSYCSGETIRLFGSGGTSYSWAGPSGFTSNLAYPTRSSAQTSMSGVYSLTVTNSNCTATPTASTTVSVSVSSPATISGSSTYCSGQTISLTASGGGTYSWGGPNGFSSSEAGFSIASATTANAGIYTVTVSNGTCTASSSVSIAVSAPPQIAINGTTSYCTGANMILTITGGSSYSWSGPNNFSSTSSRPIINGLTTANDGVYSVTATSSASGCTASTTVAITVNPAKQTYASPRFTYPLCNGSTLILRNGFTNTSPVGYQWAGVGGFSSTSENPTVGVFGSNTAGDYSVTVFDLSTPSCSSTGMVSITQTFNVSVPSSSIMACEGREVALGVIIPLGADSQQPSGYRWSGPGEFSSTLHDVSIAALSTSQAGIYSVSVVNSSSPTCFVSNTVSVGIITPNVSSAVKPACTPVTSNPRYTYRFTSIQFNTLSFTSEQEAGPNFYADRTCIGTTVVSGNTYNVTVGHAGAGFTAIRLYIDFNNNGELEQSERVVNTASFISPLNFNVTIPNTAVTNVPLRMRFLAGIALNTACQNDYAEVEDYALTIVDPCTTPQITINGTTTYCSGQTISLTASGGGTYSWGGPNGFSSSEAGFSIASATTTNAGVYTVTVSNGTCTASSSVSIAVSAPPQIAINGTTSYCTGANMILTITGGSSYSWSGPNNFSSTSSRPIINRLTTANDGVYSVTATSSASGCTASTTVAITVNPAKQTYARPRFTYPLCNGSTLILRNDFTNTSPVGYQWAGVGGFSSTSENPTVGVFGSNTAGAYSVTVFDLSTPSCSSTGMVSITQTFNVSVPRSSIMPCEGREVTLGVIIPFSADSQQPYGYQWSGPGGFSSTLHDASIAALSTSQVGIYSVSVVNSSSPTCFVSNTVSVGIITPNVSSAVKPACTPVTSNPFYTYRFTSIQFNTLSFTSEQETGPNFYADRTCIGTTVVSGNTYNVTVGHAGGGGVTAIRLYIDFNNNGELEQSERVVDTMGGVGPPLSFNVTIPNTAVTNVPLRMRFLAGVALNTACQNDYAEVEDYALTIVDPCTTPQIAFNGTTTYCSGQTISLTASGGGTYSWGGPNNFSSTSSVPIINGLTTANGGVYSVTVTSSVSGCTATASTTVSLTVNQRPSLGIAVPYPLCVGSNLTLRNSVSNSIAVSYQWSGVGGFSSTLENPTVGTFGPNLAGVYSVTAYNQLAPSCSSSTSLSVAQSSPPMILNNSAALACAGKSVALAVTSIVDVQQAGFQWSGPGGFNSTLQRPIIAELDANKVGVYTLSIRNNENQSCVVTNTVSVGLIASNITASVKPACTYVDRFFGLVNGYVITRIQFNTLDFSSGIEPYAYADRTCVGTTVVAGQTYNLTLSYLSNLPTWRVYIDYDNSGTFETSELVYNNIHFSTPVNISLTIPQTAVKNTPLRMRFQTGTFNNQTACEGQQGEVEDYALTIVDPCTTPQIAFNGTTTYCSGQTISLTASGGGTYSWGGPNGFSSSEAGFSIASATTANAGNYTVTVSNGTCTASSSVSIAVSARPQVAFNGTTTYCSGQTISLTASGGGTYSWGGPSGFSSSEAGFSIASATTANAGVYTVTVSNGTCTASSSVVMEVAPPLSISILGERSYCTGQTVSITASGGTQYSWTGPGGFSSTSAILSLEANASSAGLYSVIISNGICTVTGTASVSVRPSIPSIAGRTEYCTGETISLSVVSACATPTAYLWSGPNGFTSRASSITLENARTTRSGQYEVRVSYGTTSYSTSVSVTVQAAITARPVSNTPVCVGEVLSLSLSQLAEGSTAAWSGPAGFANQSLSPSIENATTANEGVYSVTVTSGYCTASATTSAEVNPSLSVSASSNSPICVGATLRLSAISSSNSGFVWRGPRSFSATTKNPTLSNAQLNNSGVYSVTLTAVGRCSATATTQVAVLALPTVNITTPSNRTAVCTGGSLMLSASVSGEVSYRWYRNNALINGQNTATLNVTQAATYRVEATNEAGCTGTTSISISAASNPAVTATNTVTGTTLRLVATPTGLRYNWSGPAGFSSTVRNPTVSNITAANAGVYTVTGLVASTGCGALATTRVTIGSSAARLAAETQESSIRLQVSPNPTAGRVIVEVYLAAPSAVTLQLFDLQGRLRSDWKLSEEKTYHREELDVSSQAEGVYLLEAQSRSERTTKRIIKVQ